MLTIDNFYAWFSFISARKLAQRYVEIPGELRDITSQEYQSLDVNSLVHDGNSVGKRFYQ